MLFCHDHKKDHADGDVQPVQQHGGTQLGGDATESKQQRQQVLIKMIIKMMMLIMMVIIMMMVMFNSG